MATLAATPAAHPQPSGPPAGPPLEITVENRVENTIDPRLFGQMLEYGGKDERGHEAAFNAATGTLREPVLDLIRRMRPTVLRFPGGAIVEHGGPWTDWIPGMNEQDPAALAGPCRFSFHAFLRLCEELNAEPLMVVKLAGSMLKYQRMEMDASVNLAAAQAAYFSAWRTAPLTAPLLEWTRLRFRNGRPDPWSIPYWQIGNEPFCTLMPLLTGAGLTPEAAARRYAEMVEKHLLAVHAVNPDARFLVEGQPANAEYGYPIGGPLLDRLRDHIHFLTWHIYHPWAIKYVETPGDDGKLQPAPASAIGDREFWNAMASAPGADPATGFSHWMPDGYAQFAAAGIPIAVTEWNVNGWWALENPADSSLAPNSLLAKGAGAASFLHAFMRQGAIVRMACQSMLVGEKWPIAGIQVRPGDPGHVLWAPTAQAVTLYRHHHGRERLRIRATGGAAYSQPFKLGNLQPQPAVAFVDPVVTRRDATLFVHLINRDFDHPRRVLLDLAPLAATPTACTLHRLAGRLHNKPNPGEPLDPAAISQDAIPLPSVLQPDGRLAFDLPPRTVSIFEIATQPASP